MKGLRSALGFLTVFGGAASPSPAALAWFGPVGLLVGALVGSAWWLAGRTVSPLLAAGLALVVDALVTGMLHLDGLADTADGLLPPVPRERRLQIMRTPDIGAFGVVVLILVIGLRWSALAAQVPSIGLVAGLWAAGRAVMCGATAFVPYARDQGLASGFADRARAARATIANVVCAGVVLSSGWRGVAALVAAVSSGAAVVLFAKRRLGGYTGDVLGAAGVCAETVGLVVAASIR